MDLMRYNGFANSNVLQTEVKQQVNSDMIVQGSFVYQRVLTTSECTNNSFTGLEMLPSALTGGASDDQRLSVFMPTIRPCPVTPSASIPTTCCRSARAKRF